MKIIKSLNGGLWLTDPVVPNREKYHPAVNIVFRFEI
jgi:hypothetical protein